MQKNKTFLNKCIFESKILKIKNKNVKRYFSNLLNYKLIILKLIFFILFSTLIFTSCFGIREYFLKYDCHSIILNSGVAFSQLSNASSTVVYFIQSIPVIVAFVVIMFIPNIYICCGLMILLLGGLTNIIDRSLGGEISQTNTCLKDSVIDYIKIGNVKANLADIYIIVGTGLTVLIAIIFTFKSIKNDDNLQ